MRRFLPLIIISLLIPGWTQAGGFQLNLQGCRQFAMAHTGVGVALDGSSLFFNPGAVGLLLDNRINIGGNLSMPSTTYLVPNPGIDVTQTEAQVFTSFYLYATFKSKPSSRFTFGLAINNPFGTSTKWPDVWPGMYISQEVLVSSIFIQPTVSYKVTQRFGLGVGVFYGTTNLLMRRAIRGSTIASEIPSSATFSGRGDGFGFTLGLYFQPSDVFSMGINYRSPVQSGPFDGTVNFDVPASLRGQYPNTTFTSDITLPGSLNFGFGYRPEESVLITFDINYTGWSVYDSLNFNLESEDLPDVKSARNYSNALAFRLGGEFRVNSRLSLRGGAYYDASPVEDGYVSPELPDADKIGFTAGAGFFLAHKLSLDVSFGYETTGERTTAFTEQGFGGTYQSNSLVAGLGINFSF